MGLRGSKQSILRRAVKDLLVQHKDAGVEFSQIERTFGSIDRCRIHQTLKNLRQCGEAYCTRAKADHPGLWFPASADSHQASNSISPTDWRRIQLARLADQANPIVPYGSSLYGGRCSSVWEYARRLGNFAEDPAVPLASTNAH